MARITAKACDAFLNELDISGVSNSVDIEIDVPQSEITSFADLAAVWLSGKPMTTVAYQAMWSTSSPNLDAAIFTGLTSVSMRAGIYPDEAIAVGDTGFEIVTMPTSEPINTSVNAPVTVTINLKGVSELFKAVVLGRNSSYSSTTTESSDQHGAVSATQKVVGILRLLSNPGGSGSNDCVVTIESDDNGGFSSATTRLTFTTLDQTDVAQIEVKEANGAITDEYWRAKVTITGAGSRTFDLLLTVGIASQA